MLKSNQRSLQDSALSMFEIALHEPRIAPNTGNIIRLTANIGCRLHLIEPLGFDLDHKKLHRAGLDYQDLANVVRHSDYEQFVKSIPGCRILGCTTKGKRHHSQVAYQLGDVLLFGSETSGLPPSVLQSLDPDHCIRIPMQPTSRSLNLSNAVAIISYEAWRQHGFKGGQ